jgi:uncharacterized protein YjiS (DUF1127 family)
MLKLVNAPSIVLVSAVERVTAPLRAAIDRQRARAALARLLDEDDHLLNDIGLTRNDIAVMLRQNSGGFTLTNWAVDTQRAAYAPH